MGLFDSLLGGGKKLKGAAPDRLFAMTTAYVTMETSLNLTSTGAAGLVFQPLATADFEQILKDAEELLAGTASETDSKIESADDEYGYRWVILRDDDFDDLVVALNTLSTELQGGGYGDRLLCAVFAFEKNAKDSPSMAHPSRKGTKIHFIYNYKRGAFYPFVPAPGNQQRDTEDELRLMAQLSNEGIPFEEDVARRFPLWEIPL